MYLTLAGAVALAGLGVYVSALFGVGQLLGVLGFMICLPWLMWCPNTPANLPKRRLLFAGAALSQGLLLAPLVRLAVALQPGVLVTALGGTAGACVWLLRRRRRRSARAGRRAREVVCVGGL